MMPSKDSSGLPPLLYAPQKGGHTYSHPPKGGYGGRYAPLPKGTGPPLNRAAVLRHEKISEEIRKQAKNTEEQERKRQLLLEVHRTRFYPQLTKRVFGSEGSGTSLPARKSARGRRGRMTRLTPLSNSTGENELDKQMKEDSLIQRKLLAKNESTFPDKITVDKDSNINNNETSPSSKEFNKEKVNRIEEKVEEKEEIKENSERSETVQIEASQASGNEANDQDNLPSDKDYVSRVSSVRQHLHQQAFPLLQDSLVRIRQDLSDPAQPPIAENVNLGLIPLLLQCCQIHDHTKIQFEASWALTNVASGTSQQTQAVVDAGAIPLLVDLLDSPSLDVTEQCIWTLGNIAGDSPQNRDAVVNANAVPKLYEALYKSDNLAYERNLAWCFANLTRSKFDSESHLDWFDICIKAILVFLDSDDQEILSDTLWSVSYIADNNNECIQKVIDTGVIPHLIKHISHSNYKVVNPTLRGIGNICTGTDQQTEEVLKAGALVQLKSLIMSDNIRANILKDGVWLLSNIFAGTTGQIQALLDAGLMKNILTILKESNATIAVQRESLWCLGNFTNNASDHQLQTAMTYQYVQQLAKGINAGDTICVNLCLTALATLIEKQISDGFNQQVKHDIEEYVTEDLLERLDDKLENGNASNLLKLLQRI